MGSAFGNNDRIRVCGYKAANAVKFTLKDFDLSGLEMGDVNVLKELTMITGLRSRSNTAVASK